MKFDPVLILVVLACFLAFMLSKFGKGRTISKQFKSSKRRKFLLGWLTVIVFMLAAMLTLIWPIQGMHSLIQGILLSAVVLVPALVLYMVAALHFRSSYAVSTRRGSSRDESLFRPDEEFQEELADSIKLPTDVYEPNGVDYNGLEYEPIDFGTDTMPSPNYSVNLDMPEDLETNETEVTSEAQVTTHARKPLTSIAALSGIPKPYGDSEKIELPSEESREWFMDESIKELRGDLREEPTIDDSFEGLTNDFRDEPTIDESIEGLTNDFREEPAIDESIEGLKDDFREEPAIDESIEGFKDDFRDAPTIDEPIDRVSQFVQSHDLGDQEMINLDDDSNSNFDAPLRKSSSSLAPTFAHLSSVNKSSTELESMEPTELTGLVTSLQEDNGRLQKLVIAQHAVIESQREAQERSKGVTRDAVKVMQAAQNSQKMAEKIARRERSERKRVQDEYHKVTSAFENAMSIISEHREALPVNERA